MYSDIEEIKFKGCYMMLIGVLLLYDNERLEWRFLFFLVE